MTYDIHRIRGLREFGIINKLVDSYVHNSTECAQPPSVHLLQETLSPLSLQQFLGLLCIYAAGLPGVFFGN